MGSYLAVFVCAALLAALAFPLSAALTQFFGAVDDTRQPPVPRAGGVAIAVGAFSGLLLVGGLFRPTGLTLLGASSALPWIALGAVVVLILGVFDDVQPLGAPLKLGVQVLVAVGLFWGGVRVQVLSLPFGAVDFGSGIGLVVTVLWLVGIANAFNLIDGADGVAAGSAFFAATAVFLISLMLGHPAISLVAAALAGGILGFLPFNLPPARAFLGDAGSLFVGMVLAAIAVEGSTKGPTLVAIAVPIVAFGVPVVDTTLAVVRRVITGRSPFARDHDHVHHQLLRAGLTPRQILGVLYTASAVFALAAMLFVNPSVRSYGVGLIVIGAGVWVFARYLRLPELNELARLVQRGAKQPKVLAQNVQLRRGTAKLATAQSIEDIQAGLAMLLEHSEFDDVLLMVSRRGERRGTTKRWRLDHGAFVEEWPPRRPDEWEIVCPFEGRGWHGELHLRRRLDRRSLLIDMNLMIELVQRALTEVASRIESPSVIH